MRVGIGRLHDLPVDACIAVADDRAVVVRIGNTVVAYRNRCLHQDSPLAGGWVRHGVITCPLHFWRYRANDGSRLGADDQFLERFPVEIVDGEVHVIVPDDEPTTSLRDRLLERARTYDRQQAWNSDQ